MRERVRENLLIALAVLGMLLGVYVLYRVAAVVLLIIIAIVITAGIDPLVTRLQAIRIRRWQVSRGLATLMVMAFALLVTLAIVAFLTVTAVTESVNFVQETLPSMESHVIAWANGLSQQYPFIPPPDNLLAQLRAQSGTIAGYLWNTSKAIFSLIGGLFTVVSVFFLTIFFSIYKEGITRTLIQFVPPIHHAEVLRVSSLAGKKMGGWLRGQLILAFLITVISIVMMLALGMKYAMLIGLCGGIGELIPMIGPYGAMFPALLIALLLGEPTWKLVAIWALFYLLSQVENLILFPRIMEREVEISPVTSIVAMLIGGSLLGLVGVLLAVPLAAAGRVILIEAIFPAIRRAHPTMPNVEEQAPPASSGKKKRKRADIPETITL